MLGRKDYTQDEIGRCRDALHQQLTAYRALADAVAATGVSKGAAALLDFGAHFFRSMTLVLDRYFVHRLRVVAGKDCNPLNEVEALSDSLISNGGVLRTSRGIKLLPGQSVLKLSPGDRVQLSEDDFRPLSAAFLAEIERKFGQVTDT